MEIGFIGLGNMGVGVAANLVTSFPSTQQDVSFHRWPPVDDD